MPTEVVQNQEMSQGTQNRELLRDSELGVLLIDAYHSAIKEDGRLEEVKVVPISDPDDKRFAYARPAWAENNESGRHEVHIRLHDLDETLARYEQIMHDAPKNVDIIANRIGHGIDPSEVTPQLLFVQSMLHELGHTIEYMNNQDDPEALKRRIKVEKAAMPAGAMSVGSMLDVESPARTYVDTHWQHIHEDTGASSIDELIAMQTVAYRDTTAEKHADMFAADVFSTNPLLAQQLMSGPLEQYRNYPGFGTAA